MKKTIVLCLLPLLSSGCTNTFVELGPQSHFDYPNSNIHPLGHVTGQSSTTSIFVPPSIPSSFKYEAIEEALKNQPGADMLINAFYFTDMTTIPIPLVPIYTTTLRVEGTAAKMTAGTQSLH